MIDLDKSTQESVKTSLEKKLKKYFEDEIIYKDLRNSNFLSSLNLPSFIRDWLLKASEDENGNINVNIAERYKSLIPKKEDSNKIISSVMEGNFVDVVTKLYIKIDIATREKSFSIPNLNLKYSETIIPENVWVKYKGDFFDELEIWGKITLGYRMLDDRKGNKPIGKISLENFEKFCPYTIDLEYYKNARAKFTIQEWIDVLLGAIDYNADGFENETQKLTMLSRLLPFVEKKVNLIELAPKGTGKSYVFGRLSRYGWISSGGILTRAKMFYDISRNTEGLVCHNDYVALDEAQTISFGNAKDEMRGILKAYMEQGTFNVGKSSSSADSGIILLDNIDHSLMSRYKNMLQGLSAFYESALIDRFHGFIEGWHIPRMTDDMKMIGWGLNSEYFASILHEMREEIIYRNIVEKKIIDPKQTDTRDTEAIKRLTTAYLKLLFPNVKSPKDISARDFDKYCLSPAEDMRKVIKIQLGIMDEEFRGKDIPDFDVVEDEEN